jgi:hypothetical protein
MAERFDKNRAEYNLTELKLTHQFALKMASIITWAVVSAISIIGVFTGATSPLALSVLGAMVIIFGIVTFAGTRSAALA